MLVFSLILGNFAGFLPITLYAHAEALPTWATNAGFDDSNATWNSSTSTLRLTQDVEIISQIDPTSDVTLDLNGKTISVAYGYINSRIIRGNANIIITGNGTIDGGDSVGAVYCFANNTVTFESGTIQNCTGGIYGAVYLQTQSSFVMTGGMIKDCTAVEGGAVYGAGSFLMTGGTIKDCTANNGGGVCLFNNGSFSMTGGTVTGNTGNASGGGCLCTS